MNLHKTITNIYIKCLKPIFSIEVLSNDEKWNKVQSFNITEKQFFYEIKTESLCLLCTKNHILIDEFDNEILAIDSVGKNIKTKNGIQTVISVEKTDIYDNAYDLSLDCASDHLYLTNGFLSHNCMIIDEMAFIPKNVIDEFFASVMPVISSSKNSKAIVVSTPNGASGLYYDIWQAANSKNQAQNTEGWKPFRIHWWETGGIRDDEWKAQQIATIGIEKWKQEFECDFLTSATARMVPDEVLEKFRMFLSETKLKSKEFYHGSKHHIMSEHNDKAYEFTIWHAFEQTKTYAASGDVAEGGGGDTSVLYIWDITDLKSITMCAKFDSNQISPTEFAYVTSKILALYGNPYYICERNGLGSGFLDSLRLTFGYENIVREAKNNEVGVVSHTQTKGKACLWAKEMMTTKGFGFKIYDKDLVEELGTFCKKDTKGGVHLVYAALQNCHDDHVMAFIWLCYLLQSEVIERYYLVAKQFTSEYGKNYAEIIQPIKDYSTQIIKLISKDPIYLDYIEFKEKLTHKLGKLIDEEKNEQDSFNYKPQQDMYFGGYDDSPSWSSNFGQFDKSAISLSQCSKPLFFIV